MLRSDTPPHVHMIHADAAKLAGQWVRVRVELDSFPEARDGFVVFDCTSVEAFHDMARMCSECYAGHKARHSKKRRM